MEDKWNSLGAKVAIHEYTHVLQQAMLSGDIVNTSGSRTLREDATSQTR